MGTLKIKINGEWVTVQIRGDKGDTGAIATVVQTTGDSTDNVMSQKAITEEVNRLKSVLLNELHPVGSIYTSINSTSPAELFGGTWEQIQDVFIYAAGSKLAGATGGEENHVLSVAEMPSHNHTGTTSTNGDHSHKWYYTIDTFTGNAYHNNVKDTNTNKSKDTSTNGAHNHTFTTNSTGSSNAHNNMPPYLVAYMWKRTA